MLGYIIAIIASLIAIFLVRKINRINESKRLILEKQNELVKKNCLILESQKNLVKENEQLQNKISNTKCLICQSPSNGKHFCYSCYSKYKNRSIDVRIKECLSAEIIDPYGNKRVKTKDGRYVRSLSEKIILDYFFDQNIRVIYEKPISYINNWGERAELHPDFYLPDYDLYIEFNGLTDKTYLRQKDYVNRIYQQKGLNVIILDSRDINDIERTLDVILEQHRKKIGARS